MRKLWRLFARVVFWSYERGSLPYDLMVIAILAFVLLTPRSWYGSRALAPGIASDKIRLVALDPSGHTEIFRIDAGALTLPTAAELQAETHDVLSRDVTALHGRTFQIVQIEPIRDSLGRVTGYNVRVKPATSP